jgi:hypothetical protein
MALKKKSLVKGIVMGVLFWVVLVTMFMPLFGGENTFDASDKLFNSISKGSTHYIPQLIEQVSKYDGKIFRVDFETEDETLGSNAKKILEKAGAQATVTGVKLEIKGDFGKVFQAALTDSDDMFYNRGEKLKERYGIEEKTALYVWWSIFKGAEKSLNEKGGKENFAAAKFIADLNARAVEVGYNFYEIEPESVSSKAGILIFALVFYVVYTLWWGYAIYFLAEGMGLQLTRGRKKEV